MEGNINYDTNFKCGIEYDIVNLHFVALNKKKKKREMPNTLSKVIKLNIDNEWNTIRYWMFKNCQVSNFRAHLDNKKYKTSYFGKNKHRLVLSFNRINHSRKKSYFQDESYLMFNYAFEITRAQFVLMRVFKLSRF